MIEECNWTSLEDDLTHAKGVVAGGFDAVICLGNSFSHLPDFEGHQRNQKIALKNFKNLIKPGGLLLIDHRNYDEILGSGLVPAKNVYYNVRTYIIMNANSRTFHCMQKGGLGAGA